MIINFDFHTFRIERNVRYNRRIERNSDKLPLVEDNNEERSAILFLNIITVTNQIIAHSDYNPKGPKMGDRLFERGDYLSRCDH